MILQWECSGNPAIGISGYPISVISVMGIIVGSEIALQIDKLTVVKTGLNVRIIPILFYFTPHHKLQNIAFLHGVLQLRGHDIVHISAISAKIAEIAVERSCFRTFKSVELPIISFTFGIVIKKHFGDLQDVISDGIITILIRRCNPAHGEHPGDRILQRNLRRRWGIKNKWISAPLT